MGGELVFPKIDVLKIMKEKGMGGPEGSSLQASFVHTSCFWNGARLCAINGSPMGEERGVRACLYACILTRMCV